MEPFFNHFTPNLIATASSNRVVDLWDLRYTKHPGPPRSVASVKLHHAATSAQWNSYGNLLLCSSFETTLQIYDTSKLINSDLNTDAYFGQVSCFEHKCPPLKPMYRLHAQFHPDPTVGFRVCSITSIGKSINFYSSKTGSLLHQFDDPIYVTKTPTVMAYHPSATLDQSSPVHSALVTGDSGGNAYILM